MANKKANSLHAVDYYFIQSRLNDDDLVSFTQLCFLHRHPYSFFRSSLNEFSSSAGHIFEVAAHWIMGKGPGEAQAE